MGTGHHQLTDFGTLRFPFNPGPPAGKYPGWRHRRKPRIGRRRGLAGQVEGRAAISWHLLAAITRALGVSPRGRRIAQPGREGDRG